MASDPIARMDMSLEDIIKQKQAEAKSTKTKSSAPANGKKVATTKAISKAVKAKSANANPQARQKNQAPGGGKRALATAITAKVSARRQSTLAQKRGLKPAAQAVAKQRSQQLASASLVRTNRTPKRGFAVNKAVSARLQNNGQRQPQLQAKKWATPQQKPAKTDVSNPLAMRITVVNSPAPQARPPTSAAPAKAQRQPLQRQPLQRQSNQRQRNSGGNSRNNIIMPGDALKAGKPGKTKKLPVVSPVAS
ncbi:hypothetical protein CYMTET_42464, partial [Cymbomonas tetramitiformis]